MKIEVSNGEIVDRATILEIKSERLREPESNAMSDERDSLLRMMRQFDMSPADPSYGKLLEINKAIWEAVGEQQKILKYGSHEDQEFAVLSARVVRLNMQRYEIKKAIDELTGSAMREFKQE